MAQEFVQQQEMTQGQQLKLASRQIAYMRMLEMPVEELKTRIENELLENAALEIDHEQREAEAMAAAEAGGTMMDDDFYSHDERADWSDAMRDYANEDDIPSYLLTEQRERGEEKLPVDGSCVETFHDQLMEQVKGVMVGDDDCQLLEYLAGSLDDDGMLKKPLYVLADEMEVYQGVQTTPQHLEKLLQIIQRFDPPGIGARSLQECLLIQARRRHFDLLAAVIEKRWDRLTTNRWDEIRRAHRLTEEEVETLRCQLLKLNPRPGNAPGEDMSLAGQRITPDFYVDVDDNGHITVTMNNDDIPPLRVSDTFRDAMMQLAASREDKLSPSQRDALVYARSKISSANLFLENLRGRRTTMLNVMQAIVKHQREYFLTGNDSLLEPLTMSDLADELGYDISAISRVCSSKWVDTPYGLRPLRWYFRTPVGVTTQDGELLEQIHIKEELLRLVGAEDKRHPLTDDALAEALKQKGFPVARRTVAKYREKLGVPVARLRKARL